MKTKPITLVLLIINSFLFAQTIEKFSINSGGASVSTAGIEILYTIGEINVQERGVETVSISEGFINAEFRILIDTKVFLQGPLVSPDTPSLMNDDLRSGGYIPTTSPYSDNATCNALVFSVTGNNAIVDWVWLELRSANDNTEIVNARSALVQRDGDVVDVDGVSNVIMRAAPTNYYVVVNHRNHLGAMSASAIGLSDSSVTTVNFTNNGFSTYGTEAQVQLASNDMALWAGNTNGLNQIRFSGADNSTNVIKDFILADPANGFNSVTFTSTGYLLIDCNLNGQGKFSGSGNDSNIIKDNVLVHPGNGFNSPTFTITQTIPE
ncbi:hemagglutinin protein [uncultured Psychroserpens sp.]|uniref:hemagglutinin protein n=1 Tax=uncultured Psychroserpens sp. TaxID=255436 RepID=UPI0026098133|nr:hemagglutinin protein [uncultured Psychroserpens sp.]